MVAQQCQVITPIQGMIDGRHLDKGMVLAKLGIFQMSQDKLVDDVPLKQTRVPAWSKSTMVARLTEH